MPRRSPLVLLLALAVLAILSPSANAITLKHHVVIPHGVTHKADVHRVVVTTVAPPDRDDDGCPNDEDSYNGPGCNAPEPVAPVISESVAPAPAYTSVATTSAGCGGITPYEGGGQCWAIPYDIVLCESGGSYTAYNPSGASGAYQLMVGGGGSPEEQDAAAAAMWDGGAGASNWVCAG